MGEGEAKARVRRRSAAAFLSVPRPRCLGFGDGEEADRYTELGWLASRGKRPTAGVVSPCTGEALRGTCVRCGPADCGR